MSDLVLPHVYTWDASALKLFLKSEAVGWIWVLCSTLYWLIPLKDPCPKSPISFEATFKTSMEGVLMVLGLWPWSYFGFLSVPPGPAGSLQPLLCCGQKGSSCQWGDTASGSASTHSWLCAAFANREELWLHFWQNFLLLCTSWPHLCEWKEENLVSDFMASLY